MKIAIGKKYRVGPSKGTVNHVSCWAAAIAGVIFAAAPASAQTFAFEVGSPIAAQDFRSKSAVFAFRTTGCADLAKVEVSAMAEGVVGKDRRSIPLQVTPSSRPGVYAVAKQWEGGNWVVVLKGSCGGMEAGAIVPVGLRGFVREASKFYSHRPSAAEIEAAMKAIPEGGYQ